MGAALGQDCGREDNRMRSIRVILGVSEEACGHPCGAVAALVYNFDHCGD